MTDPRHFQLAALTSLLAFGMLRLHFDIRVSSIARILTATLATQYAGSRLFRLPRFDPWSAMISALSLMLLLRSNSDGVLAAAAAVAILSKFVLRWNDRPTFNPIGSVIDVCVLHDFRSENDAYTAPRLVEYFDPNPCQETRSRLEKWNTTSSSCRPHRAMGSKAP
jgi:hypothetical protein